MGFESASSGTNTTATTSHSITMPSSIGSGDLLVLQFAINDPYGGATTPTGWTLRQSGGLSGSLGFCYSRVATGSDTVTVTTSTSCKSSYVVNRFSSSDWSSTAANATGYSTSPAYGALIDPGITATYVDWSHWDTNSTVSAYPSDFPNGQKNPTQFSVTMASAVSNLTAILPVNKTYTISSSSSWAGYGYYVTPSASSTVTLDAGSLQLNGRDFRSPISLNKGFMNLTGHDLEAPILEKGSLSLMGYDLTPLYNPIVLEKGVLSLRARTNFGCYRLPKKIQKIDWSAGVWPLCLTPPDDLVNGDFFGCVLTTNVAAGTKVTVVGGDYTVASGINLGVHELTKAGDYILLRYDGDQIFVVGKEPTGSDVMTITNDTENLTLDVTTASLAQVANFLATLTKKLGFAD